MTTLTVAAFATDEPLNALSRVQGPGLRTAARFPWPGMLRHGQNVASTVATIRMSICLSSVFMAYLDGMTFLGAVSYAMGAGRRSAKTLGRTRKSAKMPIFIAVSERIAFYVARPNIAYLRENHVFQCLQSA